MNPGRLISEYRPQVLLVVLLLGSLFSLVMGTETTFIHRGLSRAVSLIAYPLLKVQQATTQSFRHAYEVVKNYDDVLDKNASLSHEVASMKQQTARLHELEQENRRIRRMLNFTKTEGRLTLLPVRILESYKGLLRIDGGARKGIRISMGAVTPDGVAGIVTEVADFTSTVATIHHMDCRIGVMVSRNRLRAYDGILHASGSDLSKLCTMEYIDMKEDVRAGEWVVTSPESQFGAGMPIGRIRSVQTGVGLWKSAEIEPLVDPYRLDEIFIVLQAIDDAESIAGTSPGQNQSSSGVAVTNTLSNAPDTPDMRTLQERFAP